MTGSPDPSPPPDPGTGPLGVRSLAGERPPRPTDPGITSDDRTGGRISRRRFLGTAGAGGATTSYRSVVGWRPTLTSAAGRNVFAMVDLLTVAVVDPASRGQ